MLSDRLAARVAEMGDAPDYSRLAEEVLGIRGASAALARRLVEQAMVIDDRHEAWRRAGASICRDAPTSPGVYVLRDEEDRPLYVGKAVNVRRRLRAHFADHRWRALKPAMARTTRAEWHETGSELEALLVEASLIRELQPVVNVQVAAPAPRRLPCALFHDCVLIVPSVDHQSAELIGARVDGRWMIQRTRRNGADIAAHANRLWRFFDDARPSESATDANALAPMVFSWLAERGADTTRLDPRDAGSADDLRLQLERILQDRQLFAERLVHWSRSR